MRTKARNRSRETKAKPESNATPKRSCIGCGAKKAQRELLRIASLAGSTPVVDRDYSAPGRGAYLCYDGACLQRTQKRRALERALKLQASVPRTVWDEIEKLLKNR